MKKKGARLFAGRLALSSYRLNVFEQNKVCEEKKGSSAEGAGGDPHLLWFTKKFMGREKKKGARLFAGRGAPYPLIV